MTARDPRIIELESEGYVVLKAASYRKAQERQRVAEALRSHADEHAERQGEWARECRREWRDLYERLTFVYGVARAHGASVEDLTSPDRGNDQ